MGHTQEVLARAIHELSPRRDKPFVAINCAAIPETLLESELFGYEKGAFTGAAKQTIGKVERANGGTLFLDEIGDLPKILQVKLLRFLQNRVIERVGGHREITVDVRIICATHQNLLTMVKTAKFRDDLYYRLAHVILEVLPLRERGEDILLLANEFLDQYFADKITPFRTFSQEALLVLQNHPWPGNVRELENVVKRAALLAEGMHITSKDLHLETAVDTSRSLNLDTVRSKAESQAIKNAFVLTQGNISQTARTLGISRSTLYYLMDKYQLRYTPPEPALALCK